MPLMQCVGVVWDERESWSGRLGDWCGHAWVVWWGGHVPRTFQMVLFPLHARTAPPPPPHPAVCVIACPCGAPPFPVAPHPLDGQVEWVTQGGEVCVDVAGTPTHAAPVCAPLLAGSLLLSLSSDHCIAELCTRWRLCVSPPPPPTLPPWPLPLPPHPPQPHTRT